MGSVFSLPGLGWGTMTPTFLPNPLPSMMACGVFQTGREGASLHLAAGMWEQFPLSEGEKGTKGEKQQHLFRKRRLPTQEIPEDENGFPLWKALGYTQSHIYNDCTHTSYSNTLLCVLYRWYARKHLYTYRKTPQTSMQAHTHSTITHRVTCRHAHTRRSINTQAHTNSNMPVHKDSHTHTHTQPPTHTHTQ